jgi:hypothetical protein
MRALIDTLMIELRKDESLRFWESDRVPDCPHRACRRARQCMRPERVQGPLDADWRTCPLMPEVVPALWREAFEYLKLGPPTPREKALRALCEKHVKAAERADNPRR